MQAVLWGHSFAALSFLINSLSTTKKNFKHPQATPPRLRSSGNTIHKPTTMDNIDSDDSIIIIDTPSPNRRRRRRAERNNRTISAVDAPIDVDVDSPIEIHDHAHADGVWIDVSDAHIRRHGRERIPHHHHRRHQQQQQRREPIEIDNQRERERERHDDQAININDNEYLDNDAVARITHQQPERMRREHQREINGSGLSFRKREREGKRQRVDSTGAITIIDDHPTRTATSSSTAASASASASASVKSDSHQNHGTTFAQTNTSSSSSSSNRLVLTSQEAINQIQEIFPQMDPNHIIPKLTPPITPQSIQILIQLFVSEPSYPKIPRLHKQLKEEKKEIDYDNAEFEKSLQYKYQSNDKLLGAFPFMGKDGIHRLLAHYNGRYYKTFMHIIDNIKKVKVDGSDVEKYDECMRLMSGGKLKEQDRDMFSMERNGIKFQTTLKYPRKNRAVILVTDAVLLDEIKFTSKKMREWGKTVQKEKRRLVARKEAEETGDTVECTCCYGDYAFEEMRACNDGHLFCMDCLRRYAEEKVFGNGDLGGKGCTELMCMDTSGCQSWFSREQLIKSLNDKVMKKYDELQDSLVLEKAGLDDLCKCPECDFQASLPESEMVFQCPSCAFESCRKCGEESHIPLRCEEVEKKTETSGRLQVEEAMTKARIRHCPKGCKQGFYKTEGCNKMTCPTCKTYICYVCRAEITKVRTI